MSITNIVRTPLVLIVTALTLLTACRSLHTSSTRPISTYFPQYESLSLPERKKADSVLTLALNHEALYTLMARLKPVSSVGHSIHYFIAKDSTQHDGDKHIINIKTDSVQRMIAELEQWNRITRALSFDDIKFILIPYKLTYNGERGLELLVCRQSMVDSLINVHQDFFGQWGFVPGVDLHTLITTIEFESKYDRFRAYGYLFGYPEYAVDFFVDADKEYARTNQFVKRDFFHIPTFSRPSGNFTYAIPKGHQPTALDSTIYRKGVHTLEQYRNTREDFVINKTFVPVNYLRNFYSTSKQ